MRFSIAALWLAGVVMGQDRPSGVPLNTWVREDIFAGFLAADMPRFEAGMAKVERELKANPTDSDALSWRGGGKLLLAVRAQEAGKSDEFTRLYSEARTDFAKAAEVAQGKPTMTGVYAIVGGSYTVFADRFPAGLRREAWTASQENYLALRNLQKPYFEQIPLHMRGEILSGLAQAAQRLGDTETATQRLNEVIEKLPGSPYATRARRWQEQPATAAKTSITCQMCHEDGRLAPMMAKRPAAAR